MPHQRIKPAAKSKLKPKPHQPHLEEKDFTGGAIHALGTYQGSTGDPDIDAMVAQLVAEWDCGQRNSLIEELIITALRIGHDGAGPGELKLLNRALKEMRKANNVFRPYRDLRKVSVFGSARTAPGQPEHKAAAAFAQKMCERGFMTITGAGEGIMGAAQKGAGRENSFGLNIRLPFEQAANETIVGASKLVDFNYFFTRKLSFMKESHAVALFPGGFGTMDEGFELLTLMQTGKAAIMPVVMVDSPGGSYWKTYLQFIKEHLLRLGMISGEDLFLFKTTDDVDEAVDEILHFYKNFHSYRYIRDELVIRLNQPLTVKAVRTLNRSFPDLLAQGDFRQITALPGEHNEEQILDLPRLVFTPQKRDYGRFRILIDTINSLQTQAIPVRQDKNSDKAST